MNNCLERVNVMKISIIGAGSPYTPELFEKLAEEQNDFPVKEICLMDIDEKRLDIMHGFCCRFGARLGLRAKITKTVDRKKALDGALFANTQIRVGGNKTRAKDERICLDNVLIGQETTGPAGFAKALRTIPAMLEIARDMEQLCPEAWIINYTNPTGIVAEAVIKYTKAKIAGLCALGFYAQYCAHRALHVPQESVRYDLAGLNHLSYSYNITINGRSITPDEFEKIAEIAAGDCSYQEKDKELFMSIGAIPVSYLQYYYHTNDKLKELCDKPKTRGEEILEIEDELYSDFANPKCDTRPASLDKRGGGGYSDCAMRSMKAIYSNRDTWTVANIPNNGALRFLPDDAVIETPCMVNAAGFMPIVPKSQPPSAVCGLVSAVKNYEQLTVEAAVTGSREKALLALVAHPLVRDYDVACKVLPKLLEGSREFLPQFYNKQKAGFA